MSGRENGVQALVVTTRTHSSSTVRHTAWTSASVKAATCAKYMQYTRRLLMLATIWHTCLFTHSSYQSASNRRTMLVRWTQAKQDQRLTVPLASSLHRSRGDSLHIHRALPGTARVWALAGDQHRQHIDRSSVSCFPPPRQISSWREKKDCRLSYKPRR